MKKQSRLIISTLLIQSFLSLGCSTEQEAQTSSPKPTAEMVEMWGEQNLHPPEDRIKKLEEILENEPESESEGFRLQTKDSTTSWRVLGDRYAVSYDEDGDATAIYDLAYPDLLSKDHLHRTILGAFGFGDVNLGELVDFIINAVKGGNPDNENFKWQKRVKFLQNVKEEYGDLDGTLPENWWKKIKWKNQLHANSNKAPKLFLLSEIDLEGMAKSKYLFRKTVKKALKRLKKATGLDMMGPDNSSSEIIDHFFSHFEVRVKGDQKLEFRFINLGKNDDGYARKLVDIKNYKSSYWRGVSLKLSRELLNLGTSLIPEPVTSKVLGLILGRWLRLYSRQYKEHKKAVYYLINTAKLGDPHSPFNVLTEDELYKAGTYITNYKTDYIGIIQYLFKNRKKTWRPKLEKYVKRAEEGQKWLTSHGYEGNPLSMAFTLGSDQKRNGIFTLPHHWHFTDNPIMAHNYKHPKKAIIWRNISDGFEFLIDVVDIPVPFVSTAIGIAHDLAIGDIISGSHGWEAGLSAHLRVRSKAFREDWSEELYWLSKRRMNPFELPLDKEKKLIERRRAALGI